MAQTDIWMPFYIGDYMADTIGLTFSEHGIYILLILSYWRKGSALEEKEANAIMRGASSEESSRIATFFRIASGKWHHKRIDQELSRSKANKEMRKTRAAIASNARWKGSCSEDARRMLGASPSPSPSPSVLGSVQRTGEFADRPSLKEVLTNAQFIGLSDWKARDFFDEMESCGWLDYNRRPVQSWQAALRRVKTKWEAEGRPTSPPTGRGYSKNGNQPLEKPILEDSPEVREAKQLLRDRRK